MKLYYLMLFFILNQLIYTNPKLIYKKFSNAVVKIDLVKEDIPKYSGSGFFVGPSGAILTNYHVVKEFQQEGYSLRVRLKDGSTFTDVKVGQCSDERNIDLCLLEIGYKPKFYVKNSRKKYIIGETAYIIGHPLGLEWTISDGILSSERKISNGKVAKYETVLTQKYIDSIQVTAPISSGNSGGPIFDSKGRLLGVATWRFAMKDAQNLNFGVNSIEALAFYNQYKKKINITHYNRVNGIRPTIPYVVIEQNHLQKPKKSQSKSLYKSDSQAPDNSDHATLFHSNEKIRYKGEVELGKPNGFGVLYDYLGRRKYKGYFKKGEYHGKGTRYTNGKRIQECTYVQGECEGVGTAYFRGKKIYFGAFNKGVYHGNGIKYFDRFRYEGTFKDGKFIQGTKYLSNNHIEYKGDFSGFTFSGKGIYFTSDGIFQYGGAFENGYLNGIGEVRLRKTNETVYEGAFKQSKFEGYGEYFINGQLIYQGDFVKGYYHGTGNLYDKDGEAVHSGQFILGRPQN